MKSATEHAKDLLKRHNSRSLAGLTLMNATGDIDQASLGYQIAIDTLTYIKKQITEQKFYQVAPADFVPLAVGEGAFSQSILTNLTVSASGTFESGIINQGTANDRLAAADVGISSKTVQIANWAKAVGYTVFEVEQALRANNWDLIEAKHRARKMDWDLGLQKVAFLGIVNNSSFPGLYTQTVVNVDTTTITHRISDMTAAQFGTFVAQLIQAYQLNTAYTAFPTHFVIPQDDYNGLASPVSATFPMVSKLEYLQKAFGAIVTGGVKILPSPYGMQAQNALYNNTYRYLLYRYDPESLRMDVPVDYTVTQPNTYNNFQFQDAGYGQFSGVGVYRNLELMYLDLV